MNWYITKLIYQIICVAGDHTAQFDEQIRLIRAAGEDEAFEKAIHIGQREEDVFSNNKQELVQWKFINVAELYRLGSLMDGAEVYSRVSEVDDAGAYIHFMNQKAASIKDKKTHQLLQLL